MTTERLQMIDLCIPFNKSIRDAVTLMDKNTLGVVFVVDESYLLGVVSDGDFRRAILKGTHDLDEDVVSIMNTSPSTLPVGAGADETYAALVKGVKSGKKVFPRVDATGYIHDFSYSEDWGLLPIAEPELGGREAVYLMQCLQQNWISSGGPFVREFEEAFASYTGLQNPVAVSNGTVALTLALQSLGLTPGAEVIVPTLTFAATANAVVAAGGVPVFADCDNETWGLSPKTIEPLINVKTEAIIPVHLYGSPCDIQGLHSIAREHGLYVVEDCAEAIGTICGENHAGVNSDAATFSFFGNKTLTTGEGGMTFFSNPEVAERARVIRDHGMSKSRKYWHLVVGGNYRLTNLQAAIGLGQVERAEEIVAAKKQVASLYAQKLQGFSDVKMMPKSRFGESSFWLVAVSLPAFAAAKREVLMEALAADGVQSRTVFPTLHSMPAFNPFPKATAMGQAEIIARHGLCLPSTPSMDEAAVTRVVDSLGRNLDLLGSHV